MNFFKKKNSQTNSKLTKPDIEKLLQEAYQANPKCYEKEDGTLLIGLALTEDTDSLFPIVPEEQWAIEGKTISEWIITMVSLTNPQGGIRPCHTLHWDSRRQAPVRYRSERTQASCTSTRWSPAHNCCCRPSEHPAGCSRPPHH